MNQGMTSDNLFSLLNTHLGLLGDVHWCAIFFPSGKSTRDYLGFTFPARLVERQNHRYRGYIPTNIGLWFTMAISFFKFHLWPPPCRGLWSFRWCMRFPSRASRDSSALRPSAQRLVWVGKHPGLWSRLHNMRAPSYVGSYHFISTISSYWYMMYLP